MSERLPAITGRTIFDSVILAHIDLASAVEARKTAPLRGQRVTKEDGLRDTGRAFVPEARSRRRRACFLCVSDRFGELSVCSQVVLVAVGADGHPTPITPS